MLQERIQQVRAKVAELITKYEAGHPGQKVPQIDIRFDLRGRVAGQAGRRGWNYFMRFNTDMMQNEGWDHLINDTVPHELAHIICFANGSDYKHGWAWRRTCQWLGGSGERCHKETVTYAKGNTYVYTTSTGHTVHLSAVRHRKVQGGTVYRFRDGKGTINFASAYSLLGQQPVQAVKPLSKEVPVNTLLPKTAPVAAPWNLLLGASKADRVRARIAQAKSNGESAGMVVLWAVDNLGMTASLAKTYVQNNWYKA